MKLVCVCVFEIKAADGFIDSRIKTNWMRELRGSQVVLRSDRPGQLAASDGSLLEDGKAGAGFAIMNGTRWHGPVPGKQTVFRGELAAFDAGRGAHGAGGRAGGAGRGPKLHQAARAHGPDLPRRQRSHHSAHGGAGRETGPNLSV